MLPPWKPGAWKKQTCASGSSGGGLPTPIEIEGPLGPAPIETCGPPLGAAKLKLKPAGLAFLSRLPSRDWLTQPSWLLPGRSTKQKFVPHLVTLTKSPLLTWPTTSELELGSL